MTAANVRSGRSLVTNGNRMATAARIHLKPAPSRSVAPGLILMAAVIITAGIGILLNSDLTSSLPHLYLLPWIIALGMTLAIPNLILYYQGRWELFDPLVFASCSYFFPAFVVGGFMLTAGWSQPYFFNFIQDPQYNLPYTVVLIMLGFVGMSAGYFLPVGSRIGTRIYRLLPKRDFDPSNLVLPGIFLLVLGIFNSGVGLVLGVVGYQKTEVIESYDGLIFLTTLFWMQGTFLLWFVIFKQSKFEVKSILVMLLLFAASIAKALLSGNRAGLFQAFMILMLAFVLSGRKLSLKKTVMSGFVLAACLMIGMVYGTTFRHVKGTESTVSIGQYTENIFDTFDQVGRFDLKNSLEFGLMGLAERLDTLSSVAVVVSNYEQLEPYEESYGLDNNIWKDISTFFIPRVLWTDKPVASEPRKYSDLYFNYGENSFPITPIGDLLRNFGPIGVPIGMFLFGIVLRLIYSSLIENQTRLVWRSTFYFMLLVSISYEGFYGLLIPLLFKVGITAAVGLLIVALVARALGHRSVATEA